MQKEAKARIKTNKLLEQSGWRFFDDEKGMANIVLENNVKITKESLDEFGNDFEKTENGFTDFLLLNIKKIKILLPPLDVQKEIVAGIEEEQKLINANKKLIELFEEKIKAKIAEVWG